MRYFLLAAFAAVLLVLFSPSYGATAPRSPVRSEMPLMYDVRGNDPGHANLVVERLVHDSLTQDPTGNAYIQGSPCTTPNDIYRSVIEHHPDLKSALPNVGALPAFLHALVPHVARAEGLTGNYPMSRMQCGRPDSRQPGDQLDPTDRAREFRTNEYAWYFPNFTYPVFAGDCTNVIAAPLPKQALAPQPECVELSWNAPVGGKVRWGIGSADGPIASDACNAVRQDNGPWLAWWGECDICVAALDYIRGVLGNTAMVYNKYLYPATSGRQTLRFSTAVWSKVVYICLEYPNGVQTCGVYMRPEDWRGRYQVSIPDAFWKTDDGTCPK